MQASISAISRRIESINSGGHSVPSIESGAESERIVAGVSRSGFLQWFPQTVIEPTTPHFRVYLTPRNWLLVADDPRAKDFDSRRADILIASCRIFESSAIPACAVDVVADDRGWVVELALREENVAHRQAGAQYILRKIDSWQRPC